MLLGHRLADRCQDGRRIEAAQRGTAHLLHDHQALLAIDDDAERRNATTLQRRVRLLRGELDVVRVVVAPAQDDDVLDAPGDVELAPVDESQVARAQEGALAAVGQGGAEGRARRFLVMPIAEGHSRALDPELAHFTRRDAQPCRRVHQLDSRLGHQRAAANHVDRARAARGREGDTMALQLVAAQSPRLDLAAAALGGHEQRGFRKAVRGHLGARREAAHGERRVEAVQRRLAHRLRAVVAGLPRREVELFPLLGRGPVDGEVEGEVRAAGVRRVEARDGLEPAQRPLHERRGRHHHDGRAGDQRGDECQHQAHVVEERQPRHGAAFRMQREALADRLGVAQQVLVAHHHALRRRGRARGVLQVGEAAGVDVHRPPRARGFLADRPRIDHLRAHPRLGGQPFAKVVDRPAGGQHQRRVAVGGDRADARDMPAIARRIARDREAPRVETGDERGDEFEPRRIAQQHRLARGTLLQEAGDGARAPVELGIGERAVHRLPVGEEGEGWPAAVRLGAPPDDLRQAGDRPRKIDHRGSHSKAKKKKRMRSGTLNDKIGGFPRCKAQPAGPLQVANLQ